MAKKKKPNFTGPKRCEPTLSKLIKEFDKRLARRARRRISAFSAALEKIHDISRGKR